MSGNGSDLRVDEGPIPVAATKDGSQGYAEILYVPTVLGVTGTESQLQKLFVLISSHTSMRSALFRSRRMTERATNRMGGPQ